MTRIQSVLTRLCTAVAAACLAGCVPEEKPAPSAPKAEAAPATTTDKPPAIQAAEVFRPPAPTGAADDPRVAAAAESGDAIARALTVVHQRLQDLTAAYESKARTEGDLKDVAERLKPLVTAARADCDAILRAARDLQAELPHARHGYAAAAAVYRERAGRYRDPALTDVTRRLADEFDRLAADAPRKLKLTDAFIAQLVDMQGFLAETERCLTDTAAALKVLSAGRATPAASDDGRAFRQRLKEFLGVVTAYQDALFPKPAPPAPTTPPPPAEQAPPPRPVDDPPPVAATKRGLPTGWRMVEPSPRPAHDVGLPRGWSWVCASGHPPSWRTLVPNGRHARTGSGRP